MSLSPNEWALAAITGVTILAPLIVLIKTHRTGRELAPLFLLSLILTTGLSFLLEFLWYTLRLISFHPPAVSVSDEETTVLAFLFAFLSLGTNALVFGLAALMKKRASASVRP